jgi:hypothetical protein
MSPADGERDKPSGRAGLAVGGDEFVGVTVGDGCRHCGHGQAVVILISRPGHARFHVACSCGGSREGIAVQAG